MKPRTEAIYTNITNYRHHNLHIVNPQLSIKIYILQLGHAAHHRCDKSLSLGRFPLSLRDGEANGAGLEETETCCLNNSTTDRRYQTHSKHPKDKLLYLYPESSDLTRFMMCLSCHFNVLHERKLSDIWTDVEIQMH